GPRGAAPRLRARARGPRRHGGSGVTATGPVAVQPLPRGALVGRVGRGARQWVPAVVVLVVVLVVWQESIAVLHIKKFLAPQPTAIARTFWTDRSQLLHAGWFTFQEALGGYAMGCGLALLVALVLARWRRVGRA